ncbi:EpsG family protein [Anaerobacterium chartisolvens]|nr:EpsG family protein [Anaerobacterium chartisolvens]
MLFILAGRFVINANRSSKTRRNYLIVVFGVLCIVAAFRSYEVGTDTEQFYNAFKTILSLEWHDLDSLRYEYGFFALCKLLGYVSDDPQILLIGTSVFISFSVGRFIYKNSEDVSFSAFLFLSLNIYAQYLSLMRQALAICIIMLGLERLKKKKDIQFVIAVIIAALFHRSAIICCMFILFTRLRYTKGMLGLTTVLTVAGFMFVEKLFVIVTNIIGYGNYSDSEFVVPNYFAAVCKAAVFLAVFIFGLLCIRNKEGYNLYSISTKGFLTGRLSYGFLAFAMSVCLFSQIVAIKMIIMQRAVPYFDYFCLLWLPKAIYGIEDKSIRCLAKILVIVFTILYFVIINTFRQEWYGVVPYKTFVWP